MISYSLSHRSGVLELVESSEVLWQYRIAGTSTSVPIAPPTFEIDGTAVVASWQNIRQVGQAQELGNGAVESVFVGDLTQVRGLRLQLRVRVVPENPVIRFQYELQSDHAVAMTKASGRDRLEYFRYSTRDFKAGLEVRLGEFDETIHSFRLVEQKVRSSSYANGLSLMGPILVSSNDAASVLSAYEHGSQVPDAFVQFDLKPDWVVSVRAVKGNYDKNRMVGPNRPYETIWFQFAAMAGMLDELASRYRQFVLKHFALKPASREPYIFYNTWNFQERNQYWNHKTALDSMQEDRILREIDVAHEMGVDVYVLDTGWFQKTGDWEVHPDRFSERLAAVRKRLEGYGMKMGLWFSPIDSAVSAQTTDRHLADRMSKNGKVHEPHPVWGSEVSYSMCIASSYWESFADVLVRLCREVGVVYFKWDAIGQYGCDDANHFHGGEGESAEGREQNYAFEQIRYMLRVVDKVSRACPEAIVDFDITEGWRSVGLAFLALGKYFLVNNGPYFSSLDFPKDYFSPTVWSNVLVFPGPARSRICRMPLDFDKWIPSVLFLTHYLPDDPKSSQLDNIASLILGQNGIWGDLLTLSEEGVRRFGQFLSLYKQVRADITGSDPVRSGIVGGSPEVHEKIGAESGRGVVCIFASSPGAYIYITSNKTDARAWTHDGVSVTRLENGTARIQFETKESFSTRIVYFGVDHG